MLKYKKLISKSGVFGCFGRLHLAADHGPLTCSHLQSYDPDRALTDYISRLEALQRRLGSVTSGTHTVQKDNHVVYLPKCTKQDFYFLPRCFFICSIALWLEKIDADKWLWLEVTQLPFLVLGVPLFSIILWTLISPCGPKHFLLEYDMLYSGFLSPALGGKK